MKNLTLILAFALIVISACTSSEQKYTTKTYTMQGRQLKDTFYIPEYVTIYPDSDGSYRPYDIDISFVNPCFGFFFFSCGSFYITGLSENKPIIGLQNFIFRNPNEFKDTGNLRIYNEIIKNSLYPAGTNNLYLEGINILDVFMHGEKGLPFEYTKYNK